MERFLWICLAGAAGRGHTLPGCVVGAQRFGTTFPYGTLLNLSGCFLMALIMQCTRDDRVAPDPPNTEFRRVVF